MGNKTIFLDEESEDSLKKIKEENPEFNLSQFFQESLKNINKKKEEESEEELDNILNQAKIEEQMALNKQETIRQKMARLKILREEKEKEKEREKEKIKRKILSREHDFKVFAIESFEFDIDKMNEFAEEYSGSDMNIPEFCHFKEFKER